VGIPTTILYVRNLGEISNMEQGILKQMKGGRRKWKMMKLEI
jgi:hypothetical protein